MAAAHEPVRMLFTLLGLILPSALLLPSVAACQRGDSGMIATAGPERAQALAATWATHMGAPDRGLGPDGDMSLGETGISYDRQQDALFGRVWVNMARTVDAPPERLQAYRRMEAALNDPKIGGMFDHGGGYFVLNEERQGFFLVRRFPLQLTTPQSLISDMERLRSVGGMWTTKWFFEVAMIMHGNAKPPKEPVLLER